MFLYKKWGSRETAPFLLPVSARMDSKEIVPRCRMFVAGNVKVSRQEVGNFLPRSEKFIIGKLKVSK